MAEVSILHRLNHRHHSRPRSRRPFSTEMEPPQEEEFYYRPHSLFFDYESFSPPNNSSNPSFLGDGTASLSFGLDFHSEIENPWSEYEDPHCLLYGGEENAEQMNFVTDLFESCGAQVTEDPMWEFDSQRADDQGLEFGFGPGLGSNDGLCVMGMGSESDSEEFEVNSGLIDNDNDDVNKESFLVNNNYGDHSGNEREEFEWEEVSDRINSDESENLNSVIDRIEGISVSSDISSEGGDSMLGDDEGEEEERNLEWEVLLELNNSERNSEPYVLEEHIDQESEILRDDLPEDYVLAMEYDALFGMLVENDNALKGSPPAAKSVVENLPMVVVTKEEVGENSNNNMVACAVCKDEVSVGDKVTRLPCCHMYHGECILPWLEIRNTCPVCRFELPTDDADYEKRRRGRGGGGSVFAVRVVDGVQVRYNFELLP